MAYLGEEIKKLGFGLMRLPQKSEGVIDVEQTKVMVDKFMEAGFTYFDTAWAYAGSEDAIREALVERYPREKYQLATKMAAWINCKTRDEALAQFKTSLERTKAGYFDFYLLHNLGEHRTKYFDEYGLWDWIHEQKEAGLIRHAGFSFHSTPEELDALLTAHPEMEFVQLQINYADWENPVKSLLRGSQKTWKTGHYHGTCKRRHACNSAGSSGKASEGSRAGSIHSILGDPFCGKSGRRDHRTFRNEQCCTDGG